MSTGNSLFSRRKINQDSMYYYPSSITASYFMYTNKHGDYLTRVPHSQFGKVPAPTYTSEPARLQAKTKPSHKKHSKRNRNRRGATRLNADLTRISQSNCRNRFIIGKKLAKIDGEWVHRGMDTMLGIIVLIIVSKIGNDRSVKSYMNNKYNKLLHEQRQLIEPQSEHSSKMKVVSQWRDKNIIYKVLDFGEECNGEECNGERKGKKVKRRRRDAAMSSSLSMTIPLLVHDECNISI